MYDRNSTPDREMEIALSGEKSFLERSLSIRVLIFFLFGVTLFSYLHFREIHIEIPELNSVAQNYVVAQVDFSFPDDEATAIIREDALRDIRKIYQLSQKDIRSKRIEFENFLLYNQTWQETSEGGTFRELYQASESLEKILAKIRFTDSHTFETLQKEGFSVQNYFIYTPNTITEISLLPSDVWEQIKERYFSPTSYDPMITQLLMNFSQTHRWKLDEDIPAQRTLRKKIESQIPEKMTHVSAGDRIIDQGDKVTARHIAMLQAMKQAFRENRHLFAPLTLLGSFILTTLLLGVFYGFFKHLYKPILTSNKRMLLLVTIFVITMFIAKLNEFFIINSQTRLVDILHYPLVVPILAILICSLISARVATFSACFFSILSSFALSFEWEGFLLLNLIFSVVAILNIRIFRQRTEIFIVCLKAFLYTSAAIIAFHLYSNSFESWPIFADILSALFFTLLTLVIVLGLLPLLESGFRIMTDVTLMEFLDPNNDLVRRLSIEAPGTYQHSVILGNLAETAALAIGADGLFCRVATLYHDVGKMATAQYFTENQPQEVNIHQLLTPQESAQIIMAHVPEGVALAREAGLSEALIDIIREHHGTTLVYYFYCKELEKMGGDKRKINEKEFRYPGPKPKSKESGIIMIADSFEAASRSLERITENTVTELIDRIVKEKFEDGQFDECALTFSDINLVKKALIKTLLAAGHARVKYPTIEKIENLEHASGCS